MSYVAVGEESSTDASMNAGFTYHSPAGKFEEIKTKKPIFIQRQIPVRLIKHSLTAACFITKNNYLI